MNIEILKVISVWMKDELQTGNHPDDYHFAGRKWSLSVLCNELTNLVKLEEGRKFINGFEIDPTWVMPEPPRPGLVPAVEFHGSDGLSRFWWDPTQSKYPSALASSSIFMDDEGPVLVPDTGSRYKACEDVFRQLGFEVA